MAIRQLHFRHGLMSPFLDYECFGFLAETPGQMGETPARVNAGSDTDTDTDTHTHTYIYIHTHIHTYIRTYVHTHTPEGMI